MFCSKIFKLKFLTLVFKGLFVRAYISKWISFSSLNTLNSSQKRLHVFTDGSLVFLNRSFMLKLVFLPTSLLLHCPTQISLLSKSFSHQKQKPYLSFLSFCKLLSGPLLFYFSHIMLCSSYLYTI